MSERRRNDSGGRDGAGCWCGYSPTGLCVDSESTAIDFPLAKVRGCADQRFGVAAISDVGKPLTRTQYAKEFWSGTMNESPTVVEQGRWIVDKKGAATEIHPPSRHLLRPMIVAAVLLLLVVVLAGIAVI